MVWNGLIDVVSPTITVTAQHLTVNNTPITEYSFTFSDFLLDETSYQHPCAVGALVTESYNDINLPHDGQPYEVSGTCQVATHEASRDFTACDVVGHCTTVTANVTDFLQICGITAGVYDFEDVSILVDPFDPNEPSDIECLQVSHVKANHPAATAGIQTDSYWIIEALNSSNAPASGFNATLTMKAPFTPADSGDKLCRYTGSGWDCKADSFNAGNKTITRINVTEFSPWAIGTGVGPTAVTLQSISASSATPLWVVILLMMMGVITAVLWRRQSLGATVRVRKQ